MSPAMNEPTLLALVSRLAAASAAQENEVGQYFASRFNWGDKISFDSGEVKAFLADKLAALDTEKAEFCHYLCLALRARRVVEAGTSHGLSTLYLAAAVRHVAPGEGVVITTEYEPGKASAARENFKEAGLNAYIDLREGDLRETLRDVVAPIDFMLIDIWTPMALPALELITPVLSRGAAVICDNTAAFRAAYADYFEFIAARPDVFTTVTLPFNGGLELTVRL